MRIYYGLTQFHKPFRETIATLGVFDGVHRGHQRILRRIIHRARQKKGTSLLITFEPHPVKVLRPRQFLPLLTCPSHRLRLLSQTGLDACLVIPFTRSFSRLTAEAFVKKVLVDKVKVSELWVGFNLAFGRDRVGNASLLRRLGKQYGFRGFQVEKVCIGRERVSSSRIRRFVGRGNLSKTSLFLGRRFSIHGKVIRGSGRGIYLGAPTANLSLCGQILPPLGVYAVWVRLKKKGYWGLLNLGRRPTFSPTRKKPVAEVHLLDLKGNLYGKELEVFFLRKIREERTFATPQALARQIREDERTLRGWIARQRVARPTSRALRTQMDRLG